MRWSLVALLAAAAFIIACASAPRASADAWSAAVAIEREAIRVHPWDPDSFRHPWQYAQDGRKLTGKKRTGTDQQNERPPVRRP
jgi:hypothetical protein